ncbi:MAG: hypothetical protein KGS72_27515, partial [Cyanobacteria bacterium REEB67]|nr:hypothetical protein [Cyanobacteria bacterium REEB67]
ASQLVGRAGPELNLAWSTDPCKSIVHIITINKTAERKQMSNINQSQLSVGGQEIIRRLRTENAREIGHILFEDGTVESFDRVVEVLDKIPYEYIVRGMENGTHAFGDGNDLHEFLQAYLVDGHSQPVDYFRALKDKDGSIIEESLHSDDEMAAHAELVGANNDCALLVVKVLR